MEDQSWRIRKAKQTMARRGISTNLWSWTLLTTNFGAPETEILVSPGSLLEQENTTCLVVLLVVGPESGLDVRIPGQRGSR